LTLLDFLLAEVALEQAFESLAMAGFTGPFLYTKTYERSITFSSSTWRKRSDFKASHNQLPNIF
jgi:hypothetical protein